jgi:hypothetical protein
MMAARMAESIHLASSEALGSMRTGEETSADQSEQVQIRNPKRRMSKSKIFGGVAVLGGIGLTAYAFAKKFKEFMTWDEENKRASEDSAALLRGKLGLAKVLCDVDEPNYDDIQDALKVATQEARRLARLNGQLQRRLAGMGDYTRQAVLKKSIPPLPPQ